MIELYMYMGVCFLVLVDCICLEMIEIMYVVFEYVCVFCVCKWMCTSEED